MTTIEEAKRMAEQKRINDIEAKHGGKATEELTVRDYFATQVMQGKLAAQDGRNDGKGTGLVVDTGAFARACYQLADAMMEARK